MIFNDNIVYLFVTATGFVLLMHTGIQCENKNLWYENVNRILHNTQSLFTPRYRTTTPFIIIIDPVHFYWNVDYLHKMHFIVWMTKCQAFLFIEKGFRQDTCSCHSKRTFRHFLCHTCAFESRMISFSG
jgi:hypothetical protein